MSPQKTDEAPGQSTDRAAGLGAGCSLWILADPSISKWARKIDWYLNFQLRRAASHKTPEFAREMTEILKDCDIDAPAVQPRGELPLMVASAGLLPNSQTVVVPTLPEPVDWARACYKVWLDLNRPRTRIFLPDSITPDAFLKHWPSPGRADIELVSD